MARRCFFARKRSIPIVLLAALFYFFVRPVSFSTALQYKRPSVPTPAVQRVTTPNYEYKSLFREHASAELEAELDEQLRAIEYGVTDKGVLRAEPNIWQIGTREIEDKWQSFIEQWRSNNLEWNHHLVYDEEAMQFVHETFKSVPMLVSVFDGFPLPVLRSDILRYMLVWYHGGLYVDADTWGRLALRDCDPMVEIMQQRKDVSLLVGVEIDEPFLSAATMEAWHWSRNFGLGQFAIYAPQRFDPVLRTAIVRAVSHAMMHEQDSGWIATLEGKKYTESDILEITGPGMFTDVIIDILEEGLGDMHGFRDRGSGLDKRVTWRGFHVLRDPVWIEGQEITSGRGKGRGIGILPIDVWGNGQRHSGSGTFNAETACINHVFGHAWKKGWWERTFG